MRDHATYRRLFCHICTLVHTLIVHLLVIPIPLVVLWVVANIYNSSVDDTHCGQGLSMVPTYWILEGPRIFVIVVSHIVLRSLSLVILKS